MEVNNYSTVQIILEDDDLDSIQTDLFRLVTSGEISKALSEIEGLKQLIGLGKAAIGIKNYLFIKKLSAFLFTLKGIPVEKRKEMIKKIEESEKYTVKVGEKIVYILDRVRDHEEAKYVGKMFIAFLNEGISYEEFLRAQEAIENINLDYLKQFLSVTEGIGYPAMDSIDLMKKKSVFSLGNYDYNNALIRAGLYNSYFQSGVQSNDQEEVNVHAFGNYFKSEENHNKMEGLKAQISEVGRIVLRYLN